LIVLIKELILSNKQTKTNKMNTKQITAATKNMSFENVTKFILNIGLELELTQDLPFCKNWSVKNNKEICRISNTLNWNNNGDVRYCFND
jgi:hypothetical protein